VTEARPRFLLDEHIPVAVATGLRLLGIGADHVVEAGLAGEPDAVVLERAIKQGQIVVTRDYGDFLALVGYHLTEGNTIPGVLLVPSSIPDRDPGALVHALESWVGEIGRERPFIPSMFEWLRSRRHNGEDGWVQESRPSYTRALGRLSSPPAPMVPGSESPGEQGGAPSSWKRWSSSPG
jgi:hypothetical protein